MRRLFNLLSEKQKQFAEHRYFSLIHTCSVEDVMGITTKQLMPWVMLFQDVLDIIKKNTHDEYLKGLARHHHEEDKGHNLWFYEDLGHLGLEKEFEIFTLFGADNRVARFAAYALLVETLNTTDEKLRIFLCCALEYYGHIFFTAVASYKTLHQAHSNLKYFDNFHLQIEKNHTIFEDINYEKFLNQSISDNLLIEGKEMLARVDQAFHQLFDVMANLLEKTAMHQGNRDSVLC